MIFYKNFSGRQLRDRKEEVDVIRQCNGQEDFDHNEFELIELAHTRVLKSPEKRHGYQDTGIVHKDTGELQISHRPVGKGTLRFEPNDHGNAMAYLAKTEYNMDMLAKSYRGKTYSFLNKAIETEVKERFSKIWAKMPDSEKNKVYEREEQMKKTASEMPKYVPQTQDIKTDLSGDRMMAEIAALKRENERLRTGGVSVPDAVVEVKAKQESDPMIVTTRDGEIHDFNELPVFSLRKLAKKYGIVYGPHTDKATFVPQIIEAIEKEKQGVQVA